MAKVMLVSGLIVAYGYSLELFFGWYTGSTYERAMVMNRFVGPYWWGYWALILCNVAVPQLLWAYNIRTNPIGLVWICQVSTVGMWVERLGLCVQRLHRAFSSAFIRWEIAEGVHEQRRAAASNVPSSTRATSVSRCSVRKLGISITNEN